MHSGSIRGIVWEVLNALHCVWETSLLKYDRRMKKICLNDIKVGQNENVNYPRNTDLAQRISLFYVKNLISKKKKKSVEVLYVNQCYVYHLNSHIIYFLLYERDNKVFRSVRLQR